MAWPFKPRKSSSRLAVRSEPGRFAFALSDAGGRLRAAGVLTAETAAELARQVRALQLPPRNVVAVLPLPDAQLLPVEAPAVKPEELKAAARWRIKDLVDTRLDELTIDVMPVGDERPRPLRQVFVAAASTELMRELAARLRGCGLELSVVDMAETTQRNLQTALAQAAGLAGRATAALVRHGPWCLLTICVAGELFYTRRLDWEDQPSGAQEALASAVATADTPDAALASLDFVDYGAEPDDQVEGGGNVPALVVELQRSMDLWERSWPDLPLAEVWVQLGPDTPALGAQMQQALGLPVHVLDAEPLFPGLSALVPAPADRKALLPLLGALLRTDTRRV
jgi:MSHA biogenesis protein MshI